MTGTETPPRWDLTPIFPGLDDRSFSIAIEGLYADFDRLAARFDEEGIGEIEPRALTDADVRLLDDVLRDINHVQQQVRPVSTFLYGLTTTDSRDDKASANMVELQTRTAALGPLMKRLGSWLAALGVDAFGARGGRAGAHGVAL